MRKEAKNSLQMSFDDLEKQRESKATEIINRVRTEEHSPKSGHVPMKEQVEAHNGFLRYQLDILAPQTQQKIRENDKRIKDEVAEKPKREKKKILDITDPQDLGSLHTSANSRLHRKLYNKILTTQSRDERPHKNGFRLKYAPDTVLTDEEFALYTENLMNMSLKERERFIRKEKDDYEERNYWRQKGRIQSANSEFEDSDNWE